MRSAITRFNAQMLEWKCFVSCLLAEGGEGSLNSSNPELRRNPVRPEFQITNAQNRVVRHSPRGVSPTTSTAAASAAR